MKLVCAVSAVQHQLAQNRFIPLQRFCLRFHSTLVCLRLCFLPPPSPARALIYMIPATPPPPLILLPAFWKRQRRNIRCEILALSVRAVVFWLLEVQVQLTVNETLPGFLQFLAAVPLE